ncbi:MAG: type III-B CRISPR module-associated protein Cmr5, partial [Ktedonobacteraceae bacterium]
ATLRQYIEQRRGRQAWNNIREVKKQGEDARKFLETAQDAESKKKYQNLIKENEKVQEQYRSLARGLNAMIQINGLGQTLGFLKAKGKNKVDQGQHKKNAHFYLLSHLTHWMHNQFDPSIPDASEDKNDGLLDWVVQETTSSADYRRATTECLAYGTWLSRFAEAELKEPDLEGIQPQGGKS